VDWLLAMGYGALGGAVVEAVVSSERILAWNAARHQALVRAGGRPALSAYVDPLSDIAAGLTRVLLGALAGMLFHSQVTGGYAAIAVGCSAPTVLRQLGSARLTSAFEVVGMPTDAGDATEAMATDARDTRDTRDTRDAPDASRGLASEPAASAESEGQG
jgi:hypothetical protein